MAEKNKGAPPVAGSRRAAPGGGGTSLETHPGEPLSNGKCAVSDTVRRVQTDICDSPTWESSGSDSSAKTIPRRSSLIKVGSPPRHGGGVCVECMQTVAEDAKEGSWRWH